MVKKGFACRVAHYNETKLKFDNNKFYRTITNIQLGEAFVDRWRGLRENQILMIKIVIKIIIALLLESEFFDNKEQARLEMH